MRVDPAEDLTISNLTVNGVLSATAEALKSNGTAGLTIQNSANADIFKFNQSRVTQFLGEVTAEGNLNVLGDLSVFGFISVKPYVSQGFNRRWHTLLY